MDLSQKDRKYFVDHRTYNCPFCKRRNVAYKISSYGRFDWSNNREAWFYVARCEEKECLKESFHLSNYHIDLVNLLDHRGRAIGFTFGTPLAQIVDMPNGKQQEQALLDSKGMPLELDNVYFFHAPSSDFAVDSRIPVAIREPIFEAQNCLNNNFLTGASACLRKAIYKLLQHNAIPDQEDSRTLRDIERVDLLGKKISGSMPWVDTGFVSAMKGVHGITSRELHENEWEDLTGEDIRFLLTVVLDLLHQIYVLPVERADTKRMLAEFQEKTSAKLAGKTQDSQDTDRKDRP